MGIAIQDKTQWNKGLGEDAVKLVLEYGFDDLELNRIELTTDEANVRGRRCYEKCGFVRGRPVAPAPYRRRRGRATRS